MYSPQEILSKYFGYNKFRSGQLEIINSILKGTDTFAVMPTGGGKSICYQIPALMLSGIAIIVSPLIALMKDQVDALVNKNIPATYLNSSLSRNEYNERLHLISKGVFKILYLAPERLESKKFIMFLQELEISFIGIDEAHCISEWGHDFRPSYLNINNAITKLKKVPINAFTATATENVQHDIVKVLNMEKPELFIKGFNRPNLAYITEAVEDKNKRIIKIIKENQTGSIIIYCGSRKRVESLHEYLRLEGIKNGYYHAGLPDNFRKMQQEDFISGKQKIIIATSAFGMGIDKADVRVVIHTDLTQTIESYYQEAGRAGRDGNESKCYFLYTNGDRRLQEFFLNMSNPDIKTIEKVYNTMNELDNILLGELHYEPLNHSPLQIANRAGIKTTTCDNILNIFEREGILRRTYASGLSSVKFITNRERIIEYYNNLEDKEVLEALLRFVSFEALNSQVEFDLNKFLIKYNIDTKKFETATKKMRFDDILHYNPPKQSKGILMLSERVNFSNLNIDWEKYKNRREHSFEKLNKVQQYIETQTCKRNYILKYFGDNSFDDNCGKCSSCTSKVTPNENSAKYEYLFNIILESTYQLNGCFGRRLLIDFIKGHNVDSVQRNKLNNLECFGIGKEFTTNEIAEFIDKCLYKNMIKISDGDYPLIEITKYGNKQVKRKLQKYEFKFNKIRKNNQLFNELKSLRKEIADREYINERSIISDKHLLLIAESKPKSIENIRLIKGIRYNFIEMYAGLFIDRINNFQNTAISKEYNISDNLIEEIKKTGDLTKVSQLFKRTENDIAKELELLIKSGVEFDKLLFCNYEQFENIKTYLKVKPKASSREIKTKLYLNTNLTTLKVITALAKKELNI